MREISKCISSSKSQVAQLVGIPILFKISEGRGKSTLVDGVVDKIFPAVFTIKLSSGELRTFSYNDVHKGDVIFVKKLLDK